MIRLDKQDFSQANIPAEDTKSHNLHYVERCLTLEKKTELLRKAHRLLIS